MAAMHVAGQQSAIFSASGLGEFFEGRFSGGVSAKRPCPRAAPGFGADQAI